MNFMKIILNIKIRYIVLLIILAMPLILVDMYVRFGPFEMGYDTSAAANYAIRVATGLPIDNYPLTELEKRFSILHLTDEEWNTVSCKLSIDPKNTKFIQDCGYNDIHYVKGNKYNGNVCPDLYLPLKECVRVFTAIVYHIGPGVFKHSPDLAKDYCGHWRRNNCIAIRMPEYALTRPDIFNVILEAATHPCKFIISKEQYCEGKEECDYNKTYHAKFFKELSCKNRKNALQEKVIINVIDQNRQSKFHILTNRKE